MGQVITAENFLWTIPLSNRDTQPGQMEGCNISTRDLVHSLLITSCGMRLSDEALKVAVGFRLGQCMRTTHLCLQLICLCEGRARIVLFAGFGRVARNSVLNDLIHPALIKAVFPAVKKPQGLLRSDGKRPDGITLIPWKAGKSLVWDVTVAEDINGPKMQRPPWHLTFFLFK